MHTPSTPTFHVNPKPALPCRVPTATCSAAAPLSPEGLPAAPRGETLSQRFFSQVPLPAHAAVSMPRCVLTDHSPLRDVAGAGENGEMVAHQRMHSRRDEDDTLGSTGLVSAPIGVGAPATWCPASGPGAGRVAGGGSSSGEVTARRPVAGGSEPLAVQPGLSYGSLVPTSATRGLGHGEVARGRPVFPTCPPRARCVERARAPSLSEDTSLPPPARAPSARPDGRGVGHAFCRGRLSRVRKSCVQSTGDPKPQALCPAVSSCHERGTCHNSPHRHPVFPDALCLCRTPAGAAWPLAVASPQPPLACDGTSDSGSLTSRSQFVVLRSPGRELGRTFRDRYCLLFPSRSD